VSEARYIHIPNWRNYRHYGTRNVPWIKEHIGQLRDDDYLDLTLRQRGILHGLRLEYACTAWKLRGNSRALPRGLLDSTASLSRLLGQRVVSRDVDALGGTGFIEFRAESF